MPAAPRRRLSTILLPALALLALATVAALLWLPTADFVQAQDGQPRITAGPTITSSPASGDTYGKDESIVVAVTFSEAVSVTGEPRVRLDMGERKRWARYSSGNGGATLSFAYTVNGNDRDDDGISIGKNALKLRGGTIADGDGSAANLHAPALSDQAGHKVNGSPEEPAEPEPEPTPTPTPTPTPEPTPTPQPEPANVAPTITAGPTITSSPASGDTYGEGEAIIVAATFSEAVTVTGDVRVRLAVGERQRWARYDHSKQDGMVLVFAYKVKKVDTDADGVGIGANQLQLRGGTVADSDGNAASLDHSALADQSGHKVDGSQETAPAEGDQQQQSPPASNRAPQFASENATRSVNEDAAIGANVGDAITATDADGDALTYALTGSDTFAIDASGQITVKSALDYETQNSHSLTVSVSDEVNAAGEADAAAAVDDTIAVTVNVGNVDEAGAVSLESDADPAEVGGELRATLLDPDGVAGDVAWTWQRSADAETWDAIDGAAGASYTPAEDDAGHFLRATAAYADGHGSGKTASAATVSAVVVAAAAGDEPQSAPQETDNVPPTVSSLEIVSTPAAHDSYAAGETITIEVTFSEPVTVTGTPCLLINAREIHGSLDNAEEDRQKGPAAYASGSGTNGLRFSYTVRIGDRNRYGVGVYLYDATNYPLRLSCTEGGAKGTIRDAADNDADLRHRWLWPEKSKHMVGGPDVYPDDRTGPTITGLEVVSSPASGDTYRDRETILVQATFSEPVVVDGGPRMGIWMGRYRKEMTFRSGSGTNKLILGYRVRPEDSDGDGISTFANMILTWGPLALTDSADNDVKVARAARCERTCATTYEHGPLATQPGHKVGGSASDTAPPAVESVWFGSTQSVYGPGHELRLWLNLSDLVKVEGLGGAHPTMDFTIGGKTRTARYKPYKDPLNPQGETWDVSMLFTYIVQEGDAGAIVADAGNVNLPTGARLRDQHDNLTTSLAYPAYPRGYKVPTSYIVGKKLSVTSTPAEGDTYRAGETITISAKFTTKVTVTGTPSILLRVDPSRYGDQWARYSGGSGTNTLTFDYVVDSGITAHAGIGTELWVCCILLSGGSSIKDPDGDDAYLVFDQLTPQSGHKVNGGE